MSMRNGVLIAALSCAALAVPAHARDMNELRGEAVLRDFAKCSVKYEHDLSKQVALGRAPSRMSDEEFRRAFDARCLGLWGVNIRWTGLALRGALAEELVRRDLGQWPRLQPSARIRRTWVGPKAVKPGPGMNKQQAATAALLVRDVRVGSLGDCVARTAPDGAVAVLNTKMGSEAEATAFTALAPHVAACVKAGETSDFNRTNLRYALAASYYQLANASSGPTNALGVRPTVAISSDELSLQALHNFGTCVVARSPRGARQALDLDYRSKEYDAQMFAILKGNDYCLTPGARMKAGTVLYAGAMAEALLKSEVASAELPRRLAFDPARQTIKARSPTETMALCTALQAPQATAQLLLTEPTTKEESAAINSISPVLTQCLSKDTKLTLNKPGLRAVLALAAWRIVTTPKVPS